MEDDFFESQSPSSRIKANIVAEYFPQYCRILLKRPQTEIRYLDLFAGPGIYEDGNHSTPLLIAKACADDPILRKKVRLIFNDNRYSNELRTNLDSHFAKGTFAFEPLFGDKTVGEDQEIERYLTKKVSDKNPHPTLLFFDPWGYKGVDTKVLAEFLRHWGNEMFLFLNIKRIHAAMVNNKFDELMKALFPTTIDTLRTDRKYEATVHERLSLIMDNIAFEFRNATKDRLYHCAFKFQEEDSKGTSHFIIHFTKHPKGYELVKQVYYDFDNIGASLDKDGNYTFDAKIMDNDSSVMLDFGDQNIVSLSNQLENNYRGRTVVAKTLFDEHHPATKYCGSHYAKTLREMVRLGKIHATFNDNRTHKVSVLLNENCVLKFK